MEVDNANYVLRNRKRMYIYTIAVAIVLPFVLLSEWFDQPILGISRNIFAFLIIFIYLGYYFFRFMLNLNFVQVSIDGNKLTVRYYSLRPFSKSHNTIEIPLDSYEGYKITSRFLGLRKELVLYQRIQGKRAKYPPVSLAALNKRQIEQLTLMLNAIPRKV